MSVFGDCIRGPLVGSIVCHACGGMMRSVHDSSCIERSIASRWVAQCGRVGVSGVEVTQGWVWTWVFLLEVPSRYMSVLAPGVVGWRLYVLSFLSPLLCRRGQLVLSMLNSCIIINHTSVPAGALNF
jgi:hypothetical protein